MYVGGCAPGKLSCLLFNKAGTLSQIHGSLIWLVSLASLTQESRLRGWNYGGVCVCVCATLTYEGSEDLKSCPVCVALIKNKTYMMLQ